MKKLALLLSVVFIAACGGGGDSGGPTASGTTTTGGGGTVSKVTFNIVEAKTVARPAPVTGTEDWRRIVVTNPTTGYKETHDWKIGDTALTSFELYPTIGYTVEVLDYKKSTSYIPAWQYEATRNIYVDGIFNRQTSYVTQVPQSSTTVAARGHLMVNYGTSNFGLTDAGFAAGSDGTVTLSAATAPTITYPLATTTFSGVSGVPSSANKYGFNNLSTLTYKVKANFVTTPSPINTGMWGLMRSTSATAVGTATVLGIKGDTTVPLIGPYVTTNGTVQEYAKGLFYAKSSLLKTGENADYFVLPSNAPVSSPVVYKTIIINLPNP